MLAAAANEADGDLDVVNFRVEAVTSGTLKKNGVAVVPGSTLLSPGESLTWHPSAGAKGVINAFTVRAWDGMAASATAIQVKVRVEPAEYDFNGDGLADILWRNNATGNVQAWSLNASGTYIGGTFIAASSDLNNDAVGVADFNNDGFNDILWRNKPTGRLFTWNLNAAGATLSQFEIAATSSLAWDVSGVGDFNNDGNADILWRRKSDGNLQSWNLSAAGTVIGGTIIAATSDLNLDVAAVGDLDRDGYGDLLMRHKTTGAVSAWMTGPAGGVARTVSLAGTSDLGLDIASLADYNKDGWLDVLWRRKSDGRLTTWNLDFATAIAGQSTLANTSSSQWSVM